jgi:DNA-binding NarL/FixJ family response regulator
MYRIGREAILNAFLHAKARRVEVELEYGDPDMRLLVKDDGGGIDPEVLRAGREGHFGLAGMRERAERIGGRLRLWSAPGEGTEVELLVRGSVASTPSRKIRVLSVDDHPLLREGIAALVNAQSDMILVAQATNGREGLDQFRTHQPDVTLLDLRLPDMGGVDALTALRAEFPEARVVMFTTFEGDVEMRRALKAGARGYLLKSMPPAEILAAIRQVHAGGKRIPAEVAAHLADHLGDEDLTPREVEVLRLVAAGNRNKEVADRLFIAEETVKVHVKHVMEKLGAGDRTEAVAIAVRRGIIQL